MNKNVFVLNGSKKKYQYNQMIDLGSDTCSLAPVGKSPPIWASSVTQYVLWK